VARGRIDSNRDEETIKSLCAEILTRVKSQHDFDLLNEYRTRIRKNVPFFMRSYFAAYLLMELHHAVPSKQGSTQGSPKKGRNQAPQVRERESARPEKVRQEPMRNESSVKPEAPARADPPRKVLPEDEAARLFIGAGRNRRAYARDLLAFIEEEAGVTVDIIGEIRVLDNFSFVQIRKEAADDVIFALNGKEFRGRPVAVSYAKPKKEDAPSSASHDDTRPAPEEPSLGSADIPEESPDDTDEDI
jgi:RNA recognition motif-containing protein